MQAFVAGIATWPLYFFRSSLQLRICIVLTYGLGVVGMISTIQALPLTETDLPATTVSDSLHRVDETRGAGVGGDRVEIKQVNYN